MNKNNKYFPTYIHGALSNRRVGIGTYCQNSVCYNPANDFYWHRTDALGIQSPWWRGRSLPRKGPAAQQGGRRSTPAGRSRSPPGASSWSTHAWLEEKSPSPPHLADHNYYCYSEASRGDRPVVVRTPFGTFFLVFEFFFIALVEIVHLTIQSPWATSRH